MLHERMGAEPLTSFVRFAAVTLEVLVNSTNRVFCLIILRFATHSDSVKRHFESLTTFGDD